MSNPQKIPGLQAGEDVNGGKTSPDKSALRKSLPPVLRCNGYGVGFGIKIILAEVDLEVRAEGVTTLMGPGGTGKSTLLNSLAGVYAENGLHKFWGDAFYQGAPLSVGNHPALVAQRIQVTERSVLDTLTVYQRQDIAHTASLRRDWVSDFLRQLRLCHLMDYLDKPVVQLNPALQRVVAILREASKTPPLLMIDEPTSNLGDSDASDVLELLEVLAERMALLVVLHNQKHARQISRSIALLAGGRVQTQDDTERFFAGIKNAAVTQFILTGSCAVPAPDSKSAFLAEHIAPAPILPSAALAAMEVQTNKGATLLSRNVFRPSAKKVSDRRMTLNPIGPRGFVWIIKGRLAGTPHPGVIDDLVYDLQLLKNVGVTSLITLTEKDLPQDALAKHGMDNFHCPIVDRKAPTIAQTDGLLAHMRELLDAGNVLAVHCWAGVGRTGVILAAYLMKEQSLAALEAMARIRELNPTFIQTKEQEAFLVSYEQALKNFR